MSLSATTKALPSVVGKWKVPGFWVWLHFLPLSLNCFLTTAFSWCALRSEAHTSIVPASADTVLVTRKLAQSLYYRSAEWPLFLAFLSIRIFKEMEPSSVQVGCPWSILHQTGTNIILICPFMNKVEIRLQRVLETGSHSLSMTMRQNQVHTSYLGWHGRQ